MAHSPLGGSGMERWANCSGSPNLIKRLPPSTDEDPEYRTEGVLAHAAAAKALILNEEAWALVGSKIQLDASTVRTVDAAMADAVDVYLRYVKALHEQFHFAEMAVEKAFHHPEVHEHFYGTPDFVGVSDDALVIVDYKHGEGIAVEAVGNQQLRYYAYGAMITHEKAHGPLPEDMDIIMSIVQPRAVHSDGLIRVDNATVGALRAWGAMVLIPAMIGTETSDKLMLGEWCRFCPAKLYCDAMRDNMREVSAMADKIDTLKEMTTAEVADWYVKIDPAKMFMKAIEAKALHNLQNGLDDPTNRIGLFPKKANRVLKDGAFDAIVAELGEEAFEPATLKSPAQIDAMGTRGKALTKEWCFTPNTGVTVGLVDKAGKKPRAQIKRQSAADIFTAANKEKANG